MFAASAPATPRARTGLNAASAGTSVVFTWRTITTSTCLTGLSPAYEPEVGALDDAVAEPFTVTVVLFTPSR